MTVHENPVGATVEWYTPPELFERLGVTFDLDPAGSPNATWVPAAESYQRLHDGLAQSWEGKVWLNPPYGPAGVAFVRRWIEHGNGMLLLPARTETQIFQEAARAADVVCFLRDRLHFIREDGFQARSSFASALLAVGGRNDLDLRKADLGWNVVNKRCRWSYANSMSFAFCDTHGDYSKDWPPTHFGRELAA